MTRMSPDMMVRWHAVRRLSFTLAELMISITIIAVLSAAAIFALYGVTENAKAARTRGQITRLNALLMGKWESYRVRSLPLTAKLPTNNPTLAAQTRLLALRELMRLEMPDRITDVIDPPSPAYFPVRGVSLWRSYNRIVNDKMGGTGWKTPPFTAWTRQYQGAECLYLIVSHLRDGEKKGLDFLKPSEIGDLDGDGMNEILDGWGRPIEFLRWAPGFATTPGPDGAWGRLNVDDNGDGTIDDPFEIGWQGSDDRSLIQDRGVVPPTGPNESPDQFDPMMVDSQRTTAASVTYLTYNLYPLVFSAGPDGVYDIRTDLGTNNFRYSGTTPQANDPYYELPGPPAVILGQPVDVSGAGAGGPDGVLGSIDNISNHELMVE